MNKPTAKANAIHQLLLAGMIESRSGAPRWPLARNISEKSIESAARRWLP
jgi:hypothetical protein